MTHFKSHLCVPIAVLVLALAPLSGNERSRATAQTQDTDKVLEIERYPDEPLQLVDLRIGPQSVNDRIKLKFKDHKSKWSIDSVRFTEKDDWYKDLSITLRNTSDRTVYGVQGFIFFKPAGGRMNFMLQLTNSKQLWIEPLEPGAELELSVDQDSLNQTLANMKGQGADVGHAVVSFSLDLVRFSDELQWYRGKLVRPDSTTPGKWVPIDQP